MVSWLTVIGAWAGAFPIPLDWDRDWQVRIQYLIKFSVSSRSVGVKRQAVKLVYGRLFGKIVNEFSLSSSI